MINSFLYDDPGHFVNSTLIPPTENTIMIINHVQRKNPEQLILIFIFINFVTGDA